MIAENNSLILENNKIVENLGIAAIGGLIFWYDASTLLLNNGDRVALWGDKSGNGLLLQQSDIRRKPQYKTNAINGLPSVLFDLNTVDFLSGNQGTIMGSRNNINSFFNGRVLEYFTVFKFGSVTPVTTQINHIRGSANIVRIGNGINSASRFLVFAVDDSLANLSSTTPTVINPNQWYIAYSLFDLTGTFNRTAEIVDVTNITGTSANTITISTTHNMRLGSAANQTTLEIAENILFTNTTQMTNNDKLVVINYLKDKYNL